jgi:hypothetical protein
MLGFLAICLLSILTWSVVTGVYYLSNGDKYRYCIRALLSAAITAIIVVSPPYPLGFTVANTIFVFLWLWLFTHHYPMHFTTDMGFTEKLKLALVDVKKRGWKW